MVRFDSPFPTKIFLMQWYEGVEEILRTNIQAPEKLQEPTSKLVNLKEPGVLHEDERRPRHRTSGQVAPLDGQVGRSTQDKRVRVVKNSHKLAIRGLKNAVFTRISPPETRIDPLKPSQVVDIPHLAKNKA